MDQAPEIFSRQDRDLLIVLNNKFDNLSQDVKITNDGLRTRVRDIEVRQEVIERLNLENITKRFLVTETKVERIQWTLYAIAGIGALLMWITGAINQVLNLFMRR
jgi:hypothetical protein